MLLVHLFEVKGSFLNLSKTLSISGNCWNLCSSFSVFENLIMSILNASNEVLNPFEWWVLVSQSISDRLVDCGALKRAIEIVYAATLPKASKPFIYMSIKLPPEHIDVNVHPTKREVRVPTLLNEEEVNERYLSCTLFYTFWCILLYAQVSLLNQEIIIEKIQSTIESRLRNSNESRIFQEQVLMMNVPYQLDLLHCYEILTS